MPIPTETQVSAGGVTFRQQGENTEVALIAVGPDNRWQLPKGLVERGEEPQVAAQREVREEAGLETDFIGPLDSIEYWFYANRARGRVRFHKTVHFFLLRYLSGDVGDHDHEVNEARWFEINQAIDALTFENEKKVVRKAQEQILALS